MVQFLHIDHQHARTLIRAALISSPILGLYSTIPGLLFIANLDLSEAAVMNFQWPRNAIRLLAISAVNLLLFLSSIYVVHGKHVLVTRMFQREWRVPISNRYYTRREMEFCTTNLSLPRRIYK